MQNAPEMLRAAGLPKYVESKTLPALGQNGLRAIVAGAEYKTNEGMVSYHLRGEDEYHLANAAAVFCKELVLSRVKALYIPASHLHTVVEFYHRHADPEQINGLDGKYLVLPDLFAADWADTPASRRAIYTFVRTHYYRGGGITICSVHGSGSGDVIMDQFIEGLKTLQIA